MTTHELDYVPLRSDADKTLTEYHPQGSRDRATLLGARHRIDNIYIYISEKTYVRPTYVLTPYVLGMHGKVFFPSIEPPVVNTTCMSALQVHVNDPPYITAAGHRLASSVGTQGRHRRKPGACAFLGDSSATRLETRSF